MKTFIRSVICCSVLGSHFAYAENVEDTSSLSAKKEKNSLIKQADVKQSYKISERKILKRKDPVEEEASNFSMEELRVGAQRTADEAEVLYSKSQCRYAFMTDKEIISNRCEVKKVIQK